MLKQKPMFLRNGLENVTVNGRQPETASSNLLGSAYPAPQTLKPKPETRDPKPESLLRLLRRDRGTAKSRVWFLSGVSRALGLHPHDPSTHANNLARTARWSTRVSLGRYVTNFTQHQALKLFARGKLPFDERVVLYRVATSTIEPPYPSTLLRRNVQRF